MKDLIKKILNEQVSDKVIIKVLSQLERGVIKPPYFNNLDLIGLTEDEIITVLEKFTNGKVGKVDKVRKIIKNSRGNQIYREYSNGVWAKTEYDERSNEIYYEDSDGYWYRSEYDKDGNEIYFENSKGFWWKKEYNERGKLIYHENSIEGIILDKR